VFDDIASVSPLTAAALPTPTDFRPDGWRGASNRHRLGRTREGQWWWVHPVSGPGVMTGLHGFEQAIGNEPPMSQVMGWGFNTLVPPVAEAFCNRGLAHIHLLGLCEAGNVRVRREGINLPDVFDPRWADAVEARVTTCPTTSSLVAYLCDDELAWGPDPAQPEAFEKPGLLQVCLSLDPIHAAYHAAWEFVLATRSGGLAQLATEWNVTLPNKETLRQLTREETALDSPAYRVDLGRFLREYSQRYHRVAADILRAADPGRLIAFAPISRMTPLTVRESSSTRGDFVAVSEPGCGLGDVPELLWAVNWSELADAVQLDDPPCLSPLERMVRQGRETLLDALLEPGVVGYTWSRHAMGDIVRDGPQRCGLIDENGSPNAALAQPLAAINAGVTALRAARR
jgi:hypothetical protein